MNRKCPGGFSVYSCRKSFFWVSCSTMSCLNQSKWPSVYWPFWTFLVDNFFLTIFSGTCEFIRVDKPDFETVLRNSYENEWKDRLDAFKWLDYFHDWSESELDQLNNHSRIVEHPNNEVGVTIATTRDHSNSFSPYSK